jgi:outer membrane receptor for ferrienterochelin and colicins
MRRGQHRKFLSLCTLSLTSQIALLGLNPSLASALDERDTLSAPAVTPPLQASDLVITGTWTPHTQKDSPVEIERITGKMLEQAGATNVRQVLQDVPAIESRRAPGGFQTFQIQGLSSIHTLFLVNGQELIGTIESAIFSRDLLASPEIESIEIVKGAAAVQYGSDAIGGVINVRTRKGTQPAGALLFGQYGRFNTITTFAAPEFRTADGKFGGYISAGYSGTDGFDLNQRTAQTDGDPQFATKTVSGNFDYKLSNKVTLSLYTHYTDDDRRSKQNSTASIPSIREVKGNNERAQNIVRLDWNPDSASTFTLWGHHQTFQNDSRTFRLDTNAVVRTSRFTQELWEPQFQYTRQIGSQHLLSIGGEHDIRKQRGQSLRSGNIELTESAGWLQDEISVLPWMDVVLGGRYTTNSEYGGFFSPQTTLLIKPGNFRGRFTYTRGFRSPTLTDISSFFVEGGGFGVVGNPNLNPEKSTSYTGNAEYYFERAKIGASVFRHEVSNLIQFVTGTCSAADAAALGVSAAFCASPSNIGNSRSQGFELEAGVKPLDWLYMETGYMYLDARNQDNGSFLFTRSPHAWKTRVRVEQDRWDFTARLRYFSSFGFSDVNGNSRVDPNEKAPANVQLDLRLAYKVKKDAEIYLGADNVTESRLNVSSAQVPLPGEHLYYVGMRMTL